MDEQVPAPLAPNQVLDVVNSAPSLAVPAPVLPVLEPVLAVPLAQVENPLPDAADNVSQNVAPEIIPSRFLVGVKYTYSS